MASPVMFWLLFILAVLIGCALGTITGLIPGLHVNTVAVIILSSLPFLMPPTRVLQSLNIEQMDFIIIVASAVVALSITHTFLDFIPGAFLGAPDEATALSVLPAHRYLLAGRGYEAVYLSAVGSFGAIAVGIALLIPYRFVFGAPMGLYGVIKAQLKYILLVIIAILLLTETASVPYVKAQNGYVKGRFSRLLGISMAVVVFVVSGLFGLVVLPLHVSSPFGLPSSVLFPALSGAFGLSTLLLSLKDNVNIPDQSNRAGNVRVVNAARNFIPGGLAGSVVGFLPGMTGAQATVLVSCVRKKMSPGETILTMSAVNTSNAFFVVVALFLINKARSGAAIVLADMIPIPLWGSPLPPYEMDILLLSAVLASAVAFHLTVFFGARASSLFRKVPYEKVILAIVLSIVGMVYIFTGFVGLMILSASTVIGFIPPRVGIRRTHVMGMLMLPVLCYFWGIQIIP